MGPVFLSPKEVIIQVLNYGNSGYHAIGWGGTNVSVPAVVDDCKDKSKKSNDLGSLSLHPPYFS